MIDGAPRATPSNGAAAVGGADHRAQYDARVRQIFYATNRAPDADQRVHFSGERADRLSFGSLAVRIPERHDIGQVERPGNWRFLGLTLWRQTEDETQHFVLKSARPYASEDEFIGAIRDGRPGSALVFVHGFNVTFDEGAFRLAQIVFDTQYGGVPVLFSWPSRGNVLDYLYDQNSAQNSREYFTHVLRLLQERADIREVHVVAHSMGNHVVLDALAYAMGGPLLHDLSELVMAAPDVDRDHYRDIAARVRGVTRGMTLYASSADKALITSRGLAGTPRAGDVGQDGPVVVPGVEAIDVTAIGSEMFSLNHSVFAEQRELINDLGRLIMGSVRPPSQRSTKMIAVPENATPPKYWRFDKQGLLRSPR